MNQTITLYGIPNCDTVKKTRAWFDQQGLAYRFHDFKKEGVPAAELQRWIAALGWELLVNRKGTAWRKLDPSEQVAVVDAPSAIALLQAHSSVIKRPVVSFGAKITVGYAPEKWQA